MSKLMSKNVRGHLKVMVNLHESKPQYRFYAYY